jgi:hypothetical protein
LNSKQQLSALLRAKRSKRNSKYSARLTLQRQQRSIKSPLCVQAMSTTTKPTPSCGSSGSKPMTPT